MVEWLHFSTRIHKILRSSPGVVIHGIALDKLFTAKVSRMAHSYRSNASLVTTLDGRGADTTICKKKKTIETGYLWILIITIAGPNE